MKKALALILAAIMLLCTASFAMAEEGQTLTVVAWDAGTTPYLVAQKEAFEAAHPGVKKVGFIGRLIFPAIIMDKLRKVFPNAEIVDMDDIHYEQRMIKSPAEIALMTKNWGRSRARSNSGI